MRFGVCLTKDGRDLAGAIRDAVRELDELTRAARSGGVAHSYVAAGKRMSVVPGIARSAVSATHFALAVEPGYHAPGRTPARRFSSRPGGVEVAGRGDVVLSPSIHMTVETLAGGQAYGFGSELGLRIRRELEPLIRDVMINERRPGGVLNPTDRIHAC